MDELMDALLATLQKGERGDWTFRAFGKQWILKPVTNPLSNGG